MCGIAGFAGEGNSHTIVDMTARLAHRGPDGQGTFHNPEDNLYLGHRRLSIIDIETGAQPMTTSDGRYTIVFNGEIYNHRELRSDLTAAGAVFKTDHSDTEVLLQAYAREGPRMLHRLNGMFAFAIYDRDAHRLFLARDRFGEKPLYYFHSQSCFAFASELSTLLYHPACPQDTNENALIKFLGYGYIPSPNTWIKECYKLSPGHFLEIDLKSLSGKPKPYWTFQIDDLSNTPSRHLPDLCEELSSLLDSSVRARLDSDVPVGLLLSGGIDSSLIAAIAQNQNANLNTFSIGFQEPSYDERAYSGQVANLLKTAHHTAIFSIDDLIQQAPTYLADLDEPLGDASYLPTSLVCAEARKNVKVALTGDGADELFFGYDPFAALSTAGWMGRLIPRPLISLMQRMASFLPQSNANMSFDFKARRFLQGFETSSPLRLPYWMAPLTPAQISNLMGRAVSDEEVYEDAIRIWNDGVSQNPYDRMGEYFTRLYLADDILMKSDRASMRVGLELRSPYLDYRIADFCATLPAHLKYNKGTRKFILKQMAQKFLPPDIINRRKKGFGIPLRSWMQRMYPQQPQNGLRPLSPAFTDRCWTRHTAGTEDWRYFLWCDYVLHTSKENRKAA